MAREGSYAILSYAKFTAAASGMHMSAARPHLVCRPRRRIVVDLQAGHLLLRALLVHLDLVGAGCKGRQGQGRAGQGVGAVVCVCVVVG